MRMDRAHDLFPKESSKVPDETPGIVYPCMDFSAVSKVLNGGLSRSKGGFFHHPHLIYSALRDGFFEPILKTAKATSFSGPEIQSTFYARELQTGALPGTICS